jgi:anti-anti-sigma factor
MAVKIKTIQNLDIAILEPKGKLMWGEEIQELKTQAEDLYDQGNRKLIIDLDKVSHINSSGLGALMQVHTLYTKSGGKIKLCHITNRIKNVFVITKLIEIFDIEETIEKSLENLKK